MWWCHSGVGPRYQDHFNWLNAHVGYYSQCAYMTYTQLTDRLSRMRIGERISNADFILSHDLEEVSSGGLQVLDTNGFTWK